jgi:N-acetylglucosaminyldiphosphoundecaprenol N-acetyl-beta-D-mannosaminyltransferase
MAVQAAIDISRIPRVNVLGVGVHAVDMSSALDCLLAAAADPSARGYVTVTGVHGVIESQDDPALKCIHNRSLLSVPDGVPMVWMGRLAGHARMRQVAGPDFMPALLARSVESGLRSFLWGGGDGVVDVLAQRLLERNPRLQIVDRITPPFRPLTPDEELELVERINRTRPHFFWVGLSTPKQERFMAGFLARHRDKLMLPDQGFVMLGVGAAFDFQAGLVKEAPRWLRGSGFEWLYRLAVEPKRLWRRYLRNNPRFVLGVLQQKLFPSRFPLETVEHGR